MERKLSELNPQGQKVARLMKQEAWDFYPRIFPYYIKNEILYSEVV
ncbi:hypothetical protein V6C42_10620 [Pseudoclostridium thermosuccinogenes]|nr:hypothetical protein [Pseudoclostridium thermosuccinogenes]